MDSHPTYFAMFLLFIKERNCRDRFSGSRKADTSGEYGLRTPVVQSCKRRIFATKFLLGVADKNKNGSFSKPRCIMYDTLMPVGDSAFARIIIFFVCDFSSMGSEFLSQRPTDQQLQSAKWTFCLVIFRFMIILWYFFADVNGDYIFLPFQTAT